MDAIWLCFIFSYKCTYDLKGQQQENRVQSMTEGRILQEGCLITEPANESQLVLYHNRKLKIDYFCYETETEMNFILAKITV